LIFAVNGYYPISEYRRALNPTGIYLMAGASNEHLLPAFFQALLVGPLISRAGGQRFGFMGIANFNQEDLLALKELLEAGKILPVIDRRYPLSETGQALKYLGEKHARGKVVINVASVGP
jgi:NADPH:quinone reductase-like Zn-dependent oxidoreductase